MSRFKVGGQRVGFERDMPVLDGDGNPVPGDDPLDGPQITTWRVWVENAVFEPETPTEAPDFATMTSDMAGVTLPVRSDHVVPAVDDDDNDASFAFFDTDGKPRLNANAHVLCNGLVYEMRGDAVLEEDIRGVANHVFISCQKTGG